MMHQSYFHLEEKEKIIEADFYLETKHNSIYETAIMIATNTLSSPLADQGRLRGNPLFQSFIVCVEIIQ